MPVFSYLKAALVLLVTLVLTALFALMLYGVLVLALPKNLINVAIGFTGVSAVLFGGACVQYFAKYFLYDRDDRAELQLLGGVRFGETLEAMLSGKGATWPFAKLSASREKLRLQTPFGNYAWERADPRLIIEKTGLSSGQWKIGAEDVAMTRPTVFSTLPWNTGMIERKLKELGYEVRLRALS
jgi:hypothetical protein